MIYNLINAECIKIIQNIAYKIQLN